MAGRMVVLRFSGRALFLAAVAALLTWGAASAQSAQGVPVSQEPTVNPDQEPITVFKVSTRLTSIDVVVTDATGKPVPGFTKDDFTIFEDGALQPLRSFDPHTPKTEVAYTPPPLPKLPANTFINLATAPATGTPTVLLYDVLNTPHDQQAYAHEEMVNFIKHRKAGTQIAIFVLSDKLHLVQGFTDDSFVLTNALNRKDGHVSPSTQLSQGAAPSDGAFALIPPPASGAAPGVLQNINVNQAVASIQSAEALEQSYLLDQRIDITLAGLTEIGRFLAGLPGRKNVIWLSASFPAGVLPDANISVGTLGGDLSTRNYGDQIKEATDLLNLSHVAVYPVDVRGVIVSSAGSYSAASAQQYGPGAQGSGAGLLKFAVQQAADHATMDSIAESTGGRAFYSTNDLQTAIDKAMENGSTYYTMTYSPTNRKLDGGLRKIKVVLDKPGLKLSYRTSYYADDLQRAEIEVADGPQSPLSPSLERGAPVSHELFVEARMQPLGEPVAATPKQLEMLAQYESVTAKKTKKSAPAAANTLMQTYLITYGLLPRQLELQPEPDGAHKASLELGILSYDQDGHKLNGVDTHIEDNIPPKRYALIPNEGYHLYQNVVIPVNASSVRLAVRDTVANRIGSLEVQLPLEKTP